MPLPPLAEPADLSEKLKGLAAAVPISAGMMSALLVFNGAQTASLALLPFSKQAFRAFNRWAADTWWGWCVTLAQQIHGVHLVLSGDELPMRENALVVANHQQMPDITFLMQLARTKDRLGDMKWFVKDPIKYVPGIGWGMLFIDCVFVKRDWAADAEGIARVFSRLRRDDAAFWLISFVEGTRATPEKISASQQYARSRGLQPMEHVQVPRTKGFVATLAGLRDKIAAVYDVTIGYEDGVPTLWQFIRGHAKRAHLHLRRFPVATLPQGDEELSRWLFERFEEKDRLLDAFYRDGRFPAA